MAHVSAGLRRQWPSLILAMLLVGFVADGLCGSFGLRDLLVLRQHSAGLENEREKLLLDNNALRNRIAKLKSDDVYLQQLIRQELGYARPGETVYRFANPD